ncbi:ImuA family protein [Arvimicrobium flavum]|uniref:ImuA family protein n=1 Tax=Arvimicrobium flavum TaxID=3393320 RepID=UPI00237A10B5|nr:hypothetical protein [Mesorhizobium shangrilense]
MANLAAAQELICTLRRKIAKIEGVLPEPLASPAKPGEETIVLRRQGRPEKPRVLTGAGRFDAALDGLPSAGLVELHGTVTRDSGAVAGFGLALAGLAAGHCGLPLIWIATSEIFREAGRPYAPGLAERFGILPDRLLIAEAEKLADVLWIAEEAASLGSLAAILLEIRGNPRGLDLTATRRLHRRALAAGCPLFLLRQGASAEPTAAPVRLSVAPAASGLRHTLAGPLQGSIGPPAFRVAIDKSRIPVPSPFTLEWNRDTRAFEERDHDLAAKNIVAVAAASPDRADPAPPLRPLLAFPGAARHPAPGGQPPRGQRPEDRVPRRAG